MSARKKLMRFAVVALGLLLIVGGLVLVKFLQVSSLMAMGEEAERAGPPPEAVASEVARDETWESTLSAVGSVAGVKSVALSNDAAGRVTHIRFESGQVVKPRQVLVELDTSVERAQLASARARRDLAELTASRSRSLVSKRVLPQAQLDADEAQLRAARSEVSAIEAQIDKKIVRAPFSGRLGIRSVDLGQFLNPGTTLTTLEATGEVYVDFTLPQRALGGVKDGMPVRLTLDSSTDAIDGVITAVDPTIDDTTRSLKLRASVPNDDDKLRPGMFVNVAVVLPERASMVIVPATAIVHAPYGDSIFVVEPKPRGGPGMGTTPDGKPVKIARQQFVRLGEARGDFVAIVEGVDAGQEVVSAGAFKLRNGAPIVVDNSVKHDHQLNPRPENR